MRSIVSLLAVFCLMTGAIARGEIRTDFAMESDPKLESVEPIVVFPVQHRPLWLKALARPEADLQRQAAEAIAEAHLLGTPGFDEAKPALVKIVSAESTRPATRLAAARALIALDARESADLLFATSQKYGADARQLIEPALAMWQYQPLRKFWQQRLEDTNTRHRDLMLAIDGVRTANLASAIPSLLTIVHEPLRPSGTRLAAARAVGQLQNSNLEADVEKLLKPAAPSIVNRLCAVSLLKQHRSPDAQTRLIQLGQDEEPSIAAAALDVLNRTDPPVALPIVEQALRNRDANVRLQGIAIYVGLATPERVARLARLLDDPHPGVRGQVREDLFVLAQKAELHAPIVQTATDVLAGDDWRGQEQATLLLAALDHEPVAARLVQLLESPRAEVMVAAAWGLRQLAVRDTLPAILEKVRQQYELRIQMIALSAESDVQVGHLCEALGLMQYAPADPILRKFVPKKLELGQFSRSGAIWALGHLHAGVPDEPLATLMTGRLTEPMSAIPGEMMRVRIACAISLGRMHAQSQVEPMRKYAGPKPGIDPLSLSIRWSIHQVTGEPMPDIERPKISAKPTWFLEPLE